MNPLLSHAYFAVDALPEPAEFGTDEHLRLLLAVSRGQQQLTRERMGMIVQALSDRDVDTIAALNAEAGEADAAHTLLSPFYRRVEAMAQTPRPEA